MADAKEAKDFTQREMDIMANAWKCMVEEPKVSPISHLHSAEGTKTPSGGLQQARGAVWHDQPEIRRQRLVWHQEEDHG